MKEQVCSVSGQGMAWQFLEEEWLVTPLIRIEPTPQSTTICSHAPKSSLPLRICEMVHSTPSPFNLTVTSHCAARSKPPAIMVSAGGATQQDINKPGDFFSVELPSLNDREALRRGAVLHPILTEKDGVMLNVNVKGSIGISVHEMVAMNILKAGKWSQQYHNCGLLES